MTPCLRFSRRQGVICCGQLSRCAALGHPIQPDRHFPRPGASSDAPGLGGGRPQLVKVKYFQEPFVVAFTVSPEELLM